MAGSGMGNTDLTGGPSTARRDDLHLEDIRKAMDWRARYGGSWVAAARVVGCSEHALRLACDPGYRPVHAPARAVTTTFRPRQVVAVGEDGEAVGGAGRVGERLPRVITAHDIAGQLVLALAARAGTMGHTARSLGEAIGRDRNQTNGLLKNLCGRDLADGSGGEVGNVMRWRLTPAGVALAERLKDSMTEQGDRA
ncbi:MAG: hypothetical protein ACOYM5_02855 [Caulobacter sp.]